MASSRLLRKDEIDFWYDNEKGSLFPLKSEAQALFSLCMGEMYVGLKNTNRKITYKIGNLDEVTVNVTSNTTRTNTSFFVAYTKTGMKVPTKAIVGSYKAYVDAYILHPSKTGLDSIKAKNITKAGDYAYFTRADGYYNGDFGMPIPGTDLSHTTITRPYANFITIVDNGINLYHAQRETTVGEKALFQIMYSSDFDLLIGSNSSQKIFSSTPAFTYTGIYDSNINIYEEPFKNNTLYSSNHKSATNCYRIYSENTPYDNINSPLELTFTSKDRKMSVWNTKISFSWEKPTT